MPQKSAPPSKRSIQARQGCRQRCNIFVPPSLTGRRRAIRAPQAEALFQIGLAATRTLGQTADALAAYKRSADIYRRLQDRPNLALVLQYLGTRYEVAGDRANANAAYDESLKVSREGKDRIGEANAMMNPAFTAARQKGLEPLEQVLGITIASKATAS